MKSSVLSLEPGSGSQGAPADAAELGRLLGQRALTAHFQPIVDLRTANLLGHEALIRGPRDSALSLPKQLFEAARHADLVTQLEFECARAALTGWAGCASSGKLFVNLSASALASAMSGGGLESSMAVLQRYGVAASQLVIELTEHEHVEDLASLHGVVDLLRLQGVQMALDDFGDGRSSLRLWSELRPDYVKIDRYFTHGVAEDPNKLQTFRAMLQIAETFGARLIAEGVETEAELLALRDLEVHFAQGWYLGYPQPEPLEYTLQEPQRVLRSRDLAVLPELCMLGGRSIRARQLLLEAPAITQRTTHDELFALFEGHPDLHAIAVLDGERPVGLIDRQQFIHQYARPFFKELHGRRSCLRSANTRPILVDLQAGIDELMALLTANDQRYLREGFILTEHGCYRGLGTGQALVKAVAEARIEVARHANPLTYMPGNIPTSRHVERMLAAGNAFALAHADLNHFKPFNDFYGYWRGDEMIRLAGAVLASQCDPKRDFLGHIGGDDFVVVFQSEDWQLRCQQMVTRFAQRALALLDPQARDAGGIVALDRQGERRFYPCTSLSIGIVCVGVGQYRHAEELSTAAADAKRAAKMQGLGCYILPAATAMVPAPVKAL